MEFSPRPNLKNLLPAAVAVGALAAGCSNTIVDPFTYNNDGSATKRVYYKEPQSYRNVPEKGALKSTDTYRCVPDSEGGFDVEITVAPADGSPPTVDIRDYQACDNEIGGVGKIVAADF